MMSDNNYSVQVLLNPMLKDINPTRAGWAINTPGFSPPPNDSPYEQPDYVLIHYVRSGHGTIAVNGTVYPVGAGQAFIIPPGLKASYRADLKDPWVYQWVGFTGALAMYFATLPPVIDLPTDYFPTLCTLHERIDHRTQDNEDDIAYRLASDLLIFYANVLKPKRSNVNYVQQILDHVQLCYMQKISVEQLADSFGLDRRYLSRQFKKKMGCTIQQHILNVRMTQGRRLLALGYSVAETAALCGYSAPSIFSKLFKQVYGESPREWTKRKILEQEENFPEHGNKAT